MGRITRKESRELTRFRLREVARKEFVRSGVAGASIDRISNEAGYSKGAFYSNYRSKRDIALEILTEACAEEIAAWAGLIRSQPDLGALVPVLTQRFETFIADRERWLISSELRMEAVRDSEFAVSFRAQSAHLLASLHAMIAHLCAALGHEGKVDTAYITITVHALAFGLAGDPEGYGAFYGAAPGTILVRALLDLASGKAPLKKLEE
jgi:AcrR family transcriptional regulator